MKFEVIIRPEAEYDLEKAYSWYEDKQVGLGDRFLDQVKYSIHFIAQNPYASPKVYKDTRKHLLQKFPFKIIYFINNDKINILAVLHGKRHQKQTENRVNQYLTSDDQ